MKVEDWDVFVTQSQALFSGAPLATRLTLKYRHVDGQLTAKVTDGAKTITRRTELAADVRFVDRVALHIASSDVGAAATAAVAAAAEARAAAAAARRAASTSAGVAASAERLRGSGAQNRKRQRAAASESQPVAPIPEGDGPTAAPRGVGAAGAVPQSARAARQASRRAAKRARREERRLVAATRVTGGGGGRRAHGAAAAPGRAPRRTTS